jgi:hypothetical protein
MHVNARPFKPRAEAADERGAVLVITLLVMLAIFVFAAYAIDTAIWFVHHRHLQTQADAAALAGGDAYQINCGSAGDTTIANVVHQYDGTALSSLTPTYNTQVSVTPTPSSAPASGHALYSAINATNFTGQSTPGDTDLTGSPCATGVVDVKMTEQGLPSFFPFGGPTYINAQARVKIEQLASASGSEPLAIPSPAPSVVKGLLVDETTGATVGNGPLTLTSSNGTTYTSSTAITFNTSTTDPIGLRVETGGGTVCGTQLSCYDSASLKAGIAYIRVWSNSTAPGSGASPAAPQADDATLSPASTSGCPMTGGKFSNFVSDNQSCNVQLTATVLFPAGAVCGNRPSPPAANVGLTLAANGQTPTMTCTNSTTQTTAPCSPSAPCVATTWTSGPVSLAADNPTTVDGPVTFALSWSQMFSKVGSNTCTTTGGNPCTGSFGTVQTAFIGAYNTTTASLSRSGPIVGATVTDASTGADVMSVQQGTSQNVNINLTLLNQGFTDATDPISTGSPVTLHTSGNQGTYAIDCTNNGASTFTDNMAVGCSTPFASTTQPNPPICSNQPPGPAVCVNQNPGSGKSVEDGIDCRVNGTITFKGGGKAKCSASTSCNSPNYWASGNQLSSILGQNPADPRLVTLLIVDSDAWVGVTGSSYQAPVRGIATFYVTGWSGDPCLPASDGGSGTSGTTMSTGLKYVPDDYPGAGVSNVLLGHFVQYNVPGGGGNGSVCSTSVFGDCTPVLIK